jgi:hypothetical protein
VRHDDANAWMLSWTTRNPWASQKSRMPFC